MSIILPWPSRRERKAAITAARAGRERSVAAAAHADAVRRQIERMAAENHFAASLTDQIIRRHVRGNGGTR